MDNQTEEVWLEGVSPSDKGTGLFVFPARNEKEFGKMNWSKAFDLKNGPIVKALREGITYPNCVLEGRRDWMIAFKWIPESLASYEIVETAAQSCRAVLCVKRCAGYGCACAVGECK